MFLLLGNALSLLLVETFIFGTPLIREGGTSEVSATSLNGTQVSEA